MKHWSLEYDHCQNPNCTTPDKPHRAKGLCTTCYYRDYTRKHPLPSRTEHQRGYDSGFKDGHADGLEQGRNEVADAIHAMLEKQNGACYIDGTHVWIEMGSTSIKHKIG